MSGYAEQIDIFNPFLSVLETLQYTAAFRLPSKTNSHKIISTIIQLMGLDAYTNMLVGKDKVDEGLTRSIRKRLTIANELVSQPKILFLDEPTTGLDSSSAAIIMKEVRKTTKALGLITLATIHQPSKQIFESFYDFFKIADKGYVAYTGPIGLHSELVMRYFWILSGKDKPLSTSCNPADCILGVVESLDRDIVTSAYRSSPNYTDLIAEIEETRKLSSGINDSVHTNSDTKTTTTGMSTTSRFFLLMKRHFICNWRDSQYSYFLTFLLSSQTYFIGVLFYQTPDTLFGAFDAVSAFNYTAYSLALPLNVGSVQVIEDRAVMYREVMSGNYSRLMYLISKLLADMGFHIVNSLLITIIIYYMVGFRDGFEYMAYFYLVIFITIWMAMSIGQVYALTTPNEEFALGLCGMTLILSVFFEGFIILPSYIPSEWEWAYWSYFFRYINQGLSTNELAGQTYDLVLEICPLPGTLEVTMNSFLLGVGGKFVSDFVWSSARSCLETLNFFDPATRILVGSNATTNSTQLAVDTMQACMMQHILPSAIVDNISTTGSKDSFILAVEKIIYMISQQIIHILSTTFKTQSLRLPNPCITFTFELPADLILLLFDWAYFEDGELVAPYK